MSSYTESIKRYIERYKREVRNDGLIDPHELAGWAYRNGLHKPNVRAVIDLLAHDIAQAFREEYRTDGSRRYRAKHAAVVKSGDRTLWLWGDLDDPKAPHEHFVASFARRRQQIVGDCYQLKTDANIYNEHRRPAEPVQIVLDFTRDVEELQFAARRDRAA